MVIHNGASMAKYQGERARARDCQGVEAPWHLAFSQKATRHGYHNQTMPIFGVELREGETGTQRRGGAYNRQTPQVLIGT